MKIALITFLLTLNTFGAVQQNTTYEHERKSKWDVSPPQLTYLSIFFAAEMSALFLLNPEYVQPEDGSSDFDYNPDDLSVPEWAYFLGNHGPTMMTFGLYGYYFFGNDEQAFEKGYILTETLLIAQGITFGAKYTFNRQRPDESNYLSFPSGHTTHAFTIGTWLAMDFYRSDRFYKNGLFASLPILYSAYIGWTRIDAKKHSFADVLGGAVVGTATSYLMYKYHFDNEGDYKFNTKTVVMPNIDPVNGTYGINVRMPF
jgi:hypothetical protein